MGAIVHIPDIEADREYLYSGPRAAYRSGLGVPSCSKTS
jgi:hypothetical protein